MDHDTLHLLAHWPDGLVTDLWVRAALLDLVWPLYRQLGAQLSQPTETEPD